jgi:hypothetical protein
VLVDHEGREAVSTAIKPWRHPVDALDFEGDVVGEDIANAGR